MPFAQDIHYIDSAPNKEEKDVIVFLHGFFMDARMFQEQIAYFQDKYRVIAIDLRGFGQTKCIHNNFSLEDLASDVLGVTDSLNIKKFVLVGMSMGGYVAQRIALAHPENIIDLILIGTQSGKDNQATVEQYKNLVELWDDFQARANFVSAMLPVIVGDKHDDQRFWRSVWMTYNKDSISFPMNAMLARDDLELSNIKIPTLIIHGKDDHGIPVKAAYQMHQQIKNSVLVIIEEGRHAVNITTPHRVNEEIYNFLAIH
ncbi:alpha/beta fold hydrolase [Vibrio mediterranei]|uniref:alpha/beta fold hydrolase n=1 Tax=Vibrio mediterranei TaxID=689 RepID=UPI001EFD83C8|nr:alpha/beta hydrolase [Vibrio mediterranei]MCG9657974.1 alpha/beta hydrolase [Vibrio mediterranei]